MTPATQRLKVVLIEPQVWTIYDVDDVIDVIHTTHDAACATVLAQRVCFRIAIAQPQPVFVVSALLACLL